MSKSLFCGQERELQPWDEPGGVSGTLEAILSCSEHVACQEQSGSGKDWDQFKTNAELFGYVSTFKAMIFNAFEGP